MWELSSEFDCVYVQWRASGGVPVSSGTLYSMASWRDIQESVDHIYSRFKRPVYLFGVSMGAMASTNYLINAGKDTPVKAACFLGAPLTPDRSDSFFKNSLFGFYDWAFGKILLSKLTKPELEKLYSYSTPKQVAEYRSVTESKKKVTLLDLEDHIVAPMFGFTDRHDYRRQVSVSKRLHKIKVPCFFMHADDDMLLGPDGVPREEFKACDNLVLGLMPRGSHCMHLGGNLLPSSWF